MKDVTASGSTLKDVLQEVETRYPGLRTYVLDEQHNLRKHVNIFIDGTLIKDRAALSDSFSDNSEIYIMQALSGG